MGAPFFEEVEDLFVGFLPRARRSFESRRTGMNLKVWYAEPREHYEVQVVRGPGLEVGFHAEHRDAARNAEVLDRLLDAEDSWRAALGREPAAGPFVGRTGGPWRRVSEVWDLPRGDLAPEVAWEAADRLAAYVQAFEPVLTRARR